MRPPVCKRTVVSRPHSLPLPGAASCVHSQVETRFLPSGSFGLGLRAASTFPGILPVSLSQSGYSTSGLGGASEEVAGLQSKDHGRERGGREILVRPLVLTLSHLSLNRMWRSEGYTPTQLPQKAVNPCFIFVESTLWLAFGGSFPPSPDCGGFHILALVAVEKDLSDSTTDIGPALPRRSLPIFGGSSACPTARHPHLSFCVWFSLS